MALLEVRDLSVEFKTPDGPVRAIDSLSFALEAGASLGIVGESGAGKSQTALAIMGLMARNACVKGSIRFEETELTKLWQYKRARLRGNRMAMVFQDPMTCLNPYLRIETQIGEVMQRHRGISAKAARTESLQLLQAVQLSDARNRLRSYPHELSGGQRQRVMIAMALACRPALLLADEPTTALDVTVQAQILALFKELRRDFNVALILITHDLGVVAEVCDQTLVMYAGRGVEYGKTGEVLSTALHPYTRALLQARPRLDLPLEARLPALEGQPPDPADLPEGCAFAPRCELVEQACRSAVPEWRDLGGDRMAACRRL